MIVSWSDRIIWKSDLTDKMKCSFFQAAVVSILLYGCTTWTLTKRPGCNCRCTATSLLFHKPSNSQEQDMRGAVGKVKTNCKVTFSYGLRHMDEPVLPTNKTSALYGHWVQSG